MLTGKRFWTLTTVLCLCVLVTAGCRRKRDSDSFNSDDDIFTTDDYPGTSVQEGNVADDKRGMSPSAGNPGGFRVAFNGDRCVAMVTYTLNGGSFVGGASSDLYAHYYDGSTWTPPVGLRAIDQETTTVSSGDVIVAFLNTDGHTSSSARDRNGDAIIFWRATDIDNPTTLADDPNTCLYSTYFDVTNVASATNRYGFQEFSDRLNARDEDTENVGTIGVISDGLCGEADWENGSNSYSWGDAVTSVVAVWHQQENNDGVAGSGFEDRALHAVRFDPAESILPEIPLTPSFDTRLVINGMGASDSGTSSEETQMYDEFITYNNNIIFKISALNDTIGDDNPGLPTWSPAVFIGPNIDITLQDIAIALDTGSVFSATTLLDATASTADLIENNMDFIRTNGSLQSGNSVYGRDEGLAALVVYNMQEQQLVDPFLQSGSLCITELTEANGTFLESAQVSTDQPLIVDSVLPERVDIVMSRNGDYIWACWLQLQDSGASDQDALWGAQYATTRILSDGTFPTPDLLVNTTSGAGTLNVDVDTEPVAWFAFQDHLGYICGAQSHPAILNVFYEQSDGVFDEVDRTELDADVAVPGVVALIFLSIADIGENGDLSSGGTVVNNSHFNFGATDGGHNGDPIYYYIHDVDGTATDDFRLFAERDGTVFPGVAEIDSFVFFRQTFAQDINILATPHGTNIGQFDATSGNYDGSAFHPNSFVHVFTFENAVHENDGYAPEIRTRQFNCADSGTVFTESFVPSVGTFFQDPFQISLSDTNDGFGPNIFGDAQTGDTLGIWFSESKHIYYQECNANGSNVGWRIVDNDNNNSLTPAGDPALVDDAADSSSGLFTGPITVATRECVCDDLGCAMVFWTGSQDIIGDDVRIHVRVLTGH